MFAVGLSVAYELLQCEQTATRFPGVLTTDLAIVLLDCFSIDHVQQPSSGVAEVRQVLDRYRSTTHGLCRSPAGGRYENIISINERSSISKKLST